MDIFLEVLGRQKEGEDVLVWMKNVEGENEKCIRVHAPEVH